MADDTAKTPAKPVQPPAPAPLDDAELEKVSGGNMTAKNFKNPFGDE